MNWDFYIPGKVGLLHRVSLRNVDSHKVGRLRELRGHTSEVLEDSKERGSGAGAKVEDEGSSSLRQAQKTHRLLGRNVKDLCVWSKSAEG